MQNKKIEKALYWLENECEPIYDDHEESVEELLNKQLNNYNNVRNYIDQLENKVRELETDKQEIINRLESDIPKITKTLQDGKHHDDYSKCRLKAYRTKTKEILRLLEKKVVRRKK